MQSNFSQSIPMQATQSRNLFDWVSKFASPLFPDRTQQLLKRAREDKQIAQWVAQGSQHQGIEPFVPPLRDMLATESEAPEEPETHPEYTYSEDETLSSDIPRSLGHLTQVGAQKNYQQYARNPVAMDYNIVYSARQLAYLERQEGQQQQSSLSQQV